MDLKEFTKEMIGHKDFATIRVIAFSDANHIRVIGEFGTSELFICKGKDIAAHARNFFLEENLHLAEKILFEEVKK